jgi:hypothetical protein
MKTSSSRSPARRVASLAIAAALSAAAFASPRAALAQPAQPTQHSPADIAQARELFNRGKRARDAGDVKGALESLKAAHALAGTPITGLELAKTYVQLGMLVEARETLLGVGRLTVTAAETARSVAARDEATRLAEELERRIPAVTIRVAGVAPDAASVTVDGVAIPSAALAAPRLVNAGPHTIAATAGGSRDEAKIELHEGESKTVELKLTPAPATPLAAPAPAPESASPPAAPAPSEEPRRKTSPLVYAGFGVGAVALVAGAVTGVLAFSKASSVSGACSGLTCPRSVDGDLQTGRTMGDVSTIAFAVAGAGAAVGVAGLFLSTRETASPKVAHVEPWISPGVAGLRGEF